MCKTKHRRIDKRTQKFSRLQSFIGKSPNEIAAEIKRTGDGFTASTEWRNLRQQVINRYGGRCMCCGRVPKRGVNVDHIKPRKFFPELALDFNNLQVLCPQCNKAKGNKHHTDYRNLA